MPETLPFTSDPAQAFTVSLDGAKYQITARYNDQAGYWTFDLAKDLGAGTAATLVTEVPILIGQDLIAPYALQMGAFMATDLSGAMVDAGPDDLGDRVVVVRLSPTERAALVAQGAAL